MISHKSWSFALVHLAYGISSLCSVSIKLTAPEVPFCYCRNQGKCLQEFARQIYALICATLHGRRSATPFIDLSYRENLTIAINISKMLTTADLLSIPRPCNSVRPNVVLFHHEVRGDSTARRRFPLLRFFCRCEDGLLALIATGCTSPAVCSCSSLRLSGLSSMEVF